MPVYIYIYTHKHIKHENKLNLTSELVHEIGFMFNN